MKKCLMTAMAALVFSGTFTSCSHDIDFEGEQNKLKEIQQGIERLKIQETYEQAFKARFGTPAKNQDWGFGPQSSAARTRAAVAAPTVEEAGYTFNAQMQHAAAQLGNAESDAKPWLNSGWDDKYYTVNGSVVFSYLSDDYLKHISDVILEKIPEGKNNISSISEEDYFITTKGGPVTLTPIYHNSNSGDMISYYYYPTGSKPSIEEIKKLPKYTLGNMADPEECNTNNNAFYHKTFSLVYVDANGNVSYDFPKGYEIHFLIANTWIGRGNLSINGSLIIDHPEYYGDGRLNTAIHNSGIDYWKYQGLETAETPHIAVFSIGDKNYIGFEDWTDLDFNDVIYEVSGTDGGEDLPPVDKWEEIRVIAEDLSVGQSTDFDFNDVVFDVRRYTEGSKKGIVEVILRAAGGTLPLYVDGHEVHEAFGAEVYEMINTGAQDKGLSGRNANPVTIEIPADHYSGSSIGEIANSIAVYVTKNEVDCPLTAPEGEVASKIAVKCDFVWCDERDDIERKYSLTNGDSPFQDWVKGMYVNNDWYRYVHEKIEEYKAAKK